MELYGVLNIFMKIFLILVAFLTFSYYSSAQEIYLRSSRETVNEIMVRKNYKVDSAGKTKNGSSYEVFKGDNNIACYYDEDDYCIEVRLFTSMSSLLDIVTFLNNNYTKYKEDEWMSKDYKTRVTVEPGEMVLTVNYINIFTKYKP